MTKEISIFVDESGSFSPAGADLHSPYYILCMVFHDQSDDISSELAQLREAFGRTGIDPDHTIHAGPMIRREDEYRTMPREMRIRIFRRMMVFIQKAQFKYKCFKLFKPYNSGDGAIHDTLLQEIVDFLISHRDDFNTCDQIKVYYDNGQAQITALLNEAFAIYSSKVTFATDVYPARYRLFQVADVICTLELVKAKLLENGSISESEDRFFGGIKNFKKTTLSRCRARSTHDLSPSPFHFHISALPHFHIKNIPRYLPAQCQLPDTIPYGKRGDRFIHRPNPKNCFRK